MKTQGLFITPAMILLSAALALGCDPKGQGADTDASGETDDSQTTDTSVDTDDSEPTDTAGPLPADCSEADPETRGEFKVLIDGEFKDHELAVPCTVDAVETVEASSVTKLTCDKEGAALAVEVHLSVAPEGEVSWAAGESVKLKSSYEDQFVESDQRLELRRADDTLLVAALASGAFAPDIFAPLTIKRTEACGSPDDDSAASYQLDLALAGQPPLSLFSGQRGELPIAAGESFAVDVASAKYNECCHSSESFRLLVRRVKTG
jgi:hypothetical protein